MRDAKEIETLDGMTYLASAPKGEIIQSMAACDGEIYVCTDKHIYVLKDKKRLERLD